MELCRTLASYFRAEKPFVSLSGGGGKTTLMVALASYYRNLGKRVLMTTTTKIMSPAFHDYGADHVFGDDSVLDFFPDSACSVLYALRNDETGKWTSPPLQQLDALRERYDVMINEADGSRRLPLKIHTPRDPVIPAFTTDTVCITGVWGIGRTACEVSFGDGRNIPVDGEYLQWYVDDPEGLLKGSIPGRRTILFNGAEAFSAPEILKKLKYPDDVRVLLASEKEGKIYETIR